MGNHLGCQHCLSLKELRRLSINSKITMKTKESLQPDAVELGRLSINSKSTMKIKESLQLDAVHWPSISLSE
jgi:hypothetical protein